MVGPIVRPLGFFGWVCGACLACSRAPAPDSDARNAAGLGLLHDLAAPVAVGGDQPRLSLDAAGDIVLSWLEPVGAQGDLALKYARLRDDVWTAPAIAVRGRDWVVSAADLPSVRLLGERLWAADWRTPAVASPYAYDVRVAVSADAGASWSEPLLLNDDATATEHGFVSWFRAADRVGVVWLDGRDLASDELESNDGTPLGTSLRYAYLGADGRLQEQGVLDELACDCCQTDVVTTAAGVAVIYRDRSPEEIRDNVVRVLGENAWSEPVTLGPDGWQIEGCPVNGPALDAAGDAVVAAWFTAAGERGRVRAARSSDGGRSFGAAVDVDAEGVIGHVGVALGADAAYISWWRRAAGGGAELALRAVGATGELGPLRVVTTTASSRPDSVPQIERAGDRLVLAWTDENGEGPRVKMAYVALGGGA